MNAIAEKYYDVIIKTAADMVKIPSVSGSEKAMAEYTVKKCRILVMMKLELIGVATLLALLRGAAEANQPCITVI